MPHVRSFPLQPALSQPRLQRCLPRHVGKCSLQRRAAAVAGYVYHRLPGSVVRASTSRPTSEPLLRGVEEAWRVARAQAREVPKTVPLHVLPGWDKWAVSLKAPLDCSWEGCFPRSCAKRQCEESGGTGRGPRWALTS